MGDGRGRGFGNGVWQREISRREGNKVSPNKDVISRTRIIEVERNTSGFVLSVLWCVMFKMT